MFHLDESEFREAKGLLRNLIQIDTTNPPGNEAPAVELLRQTLEADGIGCTVLEPAPKRSNLVARLCGDGSRDPLLLNSHLDVVPADPSRWTHPPFAGQEEDDCIWGRGAIDMKGFAVMAMTVLQLLKRNGVSLKRDVIFTAVADEERNCEFGSAYLVKQHPGLVNAEYVINEVGGFNIVLQGKRFYLVQVAERGIARFRIVVRGEPGHSARPTSGSAVEKAARILTRLTQARLPHHVSTPMREFLFAKAKYANPIEAMVLRLLTRPGIGKALLHTLVPRGPLRTALQANLSNTICPTIIEAGSAINVMPSEVVIQVDGRTTPSSSAAELEQELRALLDPDTECELVHAEPATAFSTSTPFYEAICEVLRERDPAAEILPYMIYGSTDSRNYAKLGSLCYGFYPVQLPEDLDFSAMFHGDDERIPVDGFRFGIETLYDLVVRLVT